MNLEITGKINLGDSWRNYYKDASSENSNENLEESAEVSHRNFDSNIRDSIAKDIKLIAGSKLVEMFKNLNITNIISKVQILTDEKDKHKKDKNSKHKRSEEDTNENYSSKKHKHHSKENKNKHDTTIFDDLTRVKKSHKKSKRERVPETDSSTETKKKHKNERNQEKKSGNDSSDYTKHGKRSKHDKEEKSITKKQALRNIIVDVKSGIANSTTEKPKVPQLVNKHNENHPLQPIRVKDDPQLVEHIQHIHAQSLKVINDLKSKTDNYQLKNDIDLVLRSYDEKFKQFVKENKYHKIRSRTGKRKVILNAAEMSNNILERLVRFVRGKIEASGLRSGVPNVFHNAILQKRELENQRMCKKFAICRSRNTYRHFLIDMLTIVLNSNDEKVRNFHDAMTEVLKTRDFSKIMDSGTKKKFRKAVRNMELYDLMTVRSGYFIIRNILEKIHEPIKVTNKNMKSVNKTVAFIDLEDVFEEKIAPNEKNKLEWDDMLTSLRQWSNDERKDIVEIFQTIVDHVKRAIDSFDGETAKKVKQYVNKMII